MLYCSKLPLVMFSNQGPENGMPFASFPPLWIKENLFLVFESSSEMLFQELKLEKLFSDCPSAYVAMALQASGNLSLVGRNSTLLEVVLG